MVPYFIQQRLLKSKLMFVCLLMAVSIPVLSLFVAVVLLVAIARSDEPRESQVVLASIYLKPEQDEPKADSNHDTANDSRNWTCDDLILDLDTSHVALQVVSLPIPSQSKEPLESKRIRVFLPFLVSKTTNGVLQQLGEQVADAQPPVITRELVRGVYKAFDREGYWGQYQASLPEDRRSKFDTEQGSFVSFNELRTQQTVSDRGGNQIGRIVDCGVRLPNGDVVYVVLESADKAQRAIPLGAFVEHKQNSPWKIELDAEQIFQFEPMHSGRVPQNIDRGWEEYVAVRYGRPDIQSPQK